MSDNRATPQKPKNKPFCPQRVLQWAMWHPAVLILSSLAVRTMLENKHELKQLAIAEHLNETEGDILDGDIPLFL